ncbi:MAG: M28 family peptidase [Bacteroidetes bacterium]|nr:MAG: M28 family peptidase [Bacteroidota bacterium]
MNAKTAQPRTRKAFFVLTLASLFIFTTCKNEPATTPPTSEPVYAKVNVPLFQADSAYAYVAAQVAFGPRVPNSEAHEKCKAWLVEQFKKFGAEVTEQKFEAKAYTGETLQCTNIIARYNPGAQKRVLLSSHWDSRPFADSPLSTERQNEPILGADDGASGVGVLLEIARNLQAHPIEMGVDIVLFDAEDFGNNDPASQDMFSWCLGAQHWAKNLPGDQVRPKYGILLDMVGAKGARFAQDQISRQYAPQTLEKVWKLAKMMHKKRFVEAPTTIGIDDHYIVNTIARIPMIDIINKPAGSQTGFGAHWHTHQDNMDVIDRDVLGEVGQVVLAVVYRENNGQM